LLNDWFSNSFFLDRLFNHRLRSWRRILSRRFLNGWLSDWFFLDRFVSGWLRGRGFLDWRILGSRFFSWCFLG
jgi:hypothetical protein